MADKKIERFNMDDQKRRALFAVPDNYFDQLPLKIQDKISQKQNHTWYGVLFENTFIWKASIASIIVLVLLTTYLSVSHKNKTSTSGTFSDLTNGEILTYLEEETLATPDILQDEEFEIFAESISASGNEDEVVEQIDTDEIEEIVVEL